MGAFFAPQMTAEILTRFFVGTPEVSDADLKEVRKQNSQIPPDMPDEELRKQYIQFLVSQPIDTTPIEKHLTTLVQHGLVARVGTPTPALPRVQGRESEPVPTAQKKVEDVPAYRLHDLAYSYARAQNGDEQRGRALDACLAYVARYNEPSLPNFAALRPELDNLLNAAIWAFGVGKIEQGEDFVNKLYIGPQAGGGFLQYQGFASQSSRLLLQAAAAAERIGDKHNQGAHLGNLGLALSKLGHFEKAIEYYEQALSISCEIGDQRGEGNRLGNLGNAYRALGQVKKAIKYHERALSISRKIGHKRGEMADLANLGIAYSSRHEERKAIEYFEQALSISREIGDRRSEGGILDNLGIGHKLLKQFERAADYFRQANQISREIGDKSGEANNLANLGTLQDAQGDYAAALDYYQQARAIFVEIGAQHLVKQVDGNIARVRGMMGGE